MVGRRSRSSFSATALQTRIRTDAHNSGNSLRSPDLIKTVGLATSCRIFDAHVFARAARFSSIRAICHGLPLRWLVVALARILRGNL